MELNPLATLNAIGRRVVSSYPQARLELQGADDALAVGVLTTDVPGSVQIVVSVGYNGEISMAAPDRYLVEIYLPELSPDEVAGRVWDQIQHALQSGLKAVRTVGWLGPLSPSYVGPPDATEVLRASARRWSVILESAEGWGEPRS